MPTLRESIDPELAIIRTVARSLDGTARQALESARFNLFAAAEAGDRALARRWLDACFVAVATVDLAPFVRASVDRALARIGAEIDGKAVA